MIDWKQNGDRRFRDLTVWMVTGVLVLALLSIHLPSLASVTKLSPETKAYLLRENAFGEISSVKDIPASVLAKFAEIAKDPNIKIANPGEKFQATDVIYEKGLPSRRLIWGGLSKEYCVVHYEQGGYAHSFRVILLRRSGNDATFLWGGAILDRIKNLLDFRNLLKEDVLDDTLDYYW